MAGWFMHPKAVVLFRIAKYRQGKRLQNQWVVIQTPFGNVIAKEDKGKSIDFRTEQELQDFIDKYKAIKFWKFIDMPEDFSLPLPFKSLS